MADDVRKENANDNRDSDEPIVDVDLGLLSVRPERVRESPVRRTLFLQEAARETVRALLAFGFLALLFVTVYFAMSNVGDDSEWANTKQLLDVLLPAETALVGAAVAFYFARR